MLICYKVRSVHRRNSFYLVKYQIVATQMPEKVTKRSAWRRENRGWGDVQTKYAMWEVEIKFIARRASSLDRSTTKEKMIYVWCATCILLLWRTGRAASCLHFVVVVNWLFCYRQTYVTVDKVFTSVRRVTTRHIPYTTFPHTFPYLCCYTCRQYTQDV